MSALHPQRRCQKPFWPRGTLCPGVCGAPRAGVTHSVLQRLLLRCVETKPRHPPHRPDHSIAARSSSLRKIRVKVLALDISATCTTTFAHLCTFMHISSPSAIRDDSVYSPPPYRKRDTVCCAMTATGDSWTHGFQRKFLLTLGHSCGVSSLAFLLAMP